MNNIMRIMLICAFMLYKHAVVASSIFRHPSFARWQQVCEKLPPFKKHATNPCKTVLAENQLASVLEDCCCILEKERSSLLHQDTKDDEPFFYAAKRVLPHGAIIAIHGDLHGDVHALNAFMTSCLEQGYLDPEDPFTIINPDFYILFLGDYVDRGWYGCEVLYTIARLKCANPNRVFMIRGNHEDPSLNRKYGFTQELRNKFQSPEHIESLCGRFYRLLPIVLYLGTKHDFVQCCHGGIEPGFDPKPLLATVHKRYGQKIATLSPEHFVMSDRITSFATLKHYFTNPRVTDAHNGFMWNDFIVDQNDMLQIQLSSRDGYSGTMFRFGKVPTHEFLNVCSTEQKRLRCIFRAHQHSDSLIRERMLNLDQIGHEDDVGVAKLWIDSPVHSQTPHLLEAIDVVTFWVAPRTGYKTSIHAFGLLTLARDYNDWRLKTVRIVDDSI